jgi:Xaa-Pro dipeptidase
MPSPSRVPSPSSSPRTAPSEAAAVATALALHVAQDRAAALFRAIEDKRLVRPGETEEGLSRAIFALASSDFGVAKHWHRRVVRSGPHTRMLFRELPPDRTIEEDDIVSLDLGPVFGEHEADFGRSYVLGHDPEKLRLVSELAAVFHECQDFHAASPAITGRELFDYVGLASKRRGWTFGGLHAGHLIGTFPFSREERDHARNRIRPDNEWPMDAPGPNGEPRHWILEVHLLDPTGAFGGFYEELLVARPAAGPGAGG